jgi:PTS system mannose-specific IIC component
MITNVFLASIVGGFLCLDRVFLLLMLSRPIVAAPIIGFILGDTYAGLIAGALTELLWIDRIRLSMYFPPNDTIVSILIAASSIEAGVILGTLPYGLISLSVVFFVPFGRIAQRMDIWTAKDNGSAVDLVMQKAINGDADPISINHLLPLLKTWLLSSSFLMVSLLAGIYLLSSLFPLLPPWTVRGLDLFYAMVPLIGTAVALNSVHTRGAFPVFCGVFLLGTILFYYFKRVI